MEKGGCLVLGKDSKVTHRLVKALLGPGQVCIHLDLPGRLLLEVLEASVEEVSRAWPAERAVVAAEPIISINFRLVVLVAVIMRGEVLSLKWALRLSSPTVIMGHVLVHRICLKQINIRALK